MLILVQCVLEVAGRYSIKKILKNEKNRKGDRSILYYIYLYREFSEIAPTAYGLYLCRAIQPFRIFFF